MDLKDIREYVKRMLGYPSVTLYMKEEVIDNLINDAFAIIQPYAYKDKLLTVNAEASIDLSAEKVMQVLDVYPAVAVNDLSNPFILDLADRRYVNNRDFPTYKDIPLPNGRPSTPLNWYFDKPFLYISTTSLYMGSVTVKCQVSVELSEITDSRVQSWLYRYSLALCKEVEGRIRSKFKSSNIPIELDGDTLLGEASSEKSELLSELNDRAYGNIFTAR